MLCAGLYRVLSRAAFEALKPEIPDTMYEGGFI